MQDIRYVVVHKPGRAWLPGKPIFDQPGVRDHVAYYRALLEQGRLELGGPFLDVAGGGMMIPVAGETEASIAEFASADPCVLSGLLEFDVRPWLIGMTK